MTKTPRPKSKPVVAPLSASDDQIEEKLEAIFQDEKGAMPDLSRLEHHGRSRLLVWTTVLAGFILLLLTAAWAGFVVFKPLKGFSGQGLEMVLDGPDQVTLGEELTYTINWRNVSTQPLAASDIRLSFPTDFKLVSSEPMSSSEGLFWRLGSIPVGGSGHIIVRGIFTGALGTQTAAQLVGTYRPASFNSTFESLSTKALSYTSTVLEGGFDLPEKFLPGDRVRVSYHIQNTGVADMAHLEVRITLPEGFVRESSSTEDLLDGRIVRLPLPILAANATSSVSLIGSFTSGVSGAALFQAEVGRVTDSNVFLPAQRGEASVRVLAGDLSVKLVVNGSDTDRSVKAGDRLHIGIAYENTANEDVKDVAIRLAIVPVPATGVTSSLDALPSPINWSDLDDQASGTVQGASITWNGDGLAVLKRLAPHDEGTIDLSLGTSTSVPATLDGFQLVVEATMQAVGETKVKRTIRTVPMTFVFRSDASVTAEARYFSEEGAPLGSGPLPPVAGSSTRYRIFWTLQKQIHALEGIRVSAPLPKNVVWGSMTTSTAGELTYDAQLREVVWTLNRLPKEVNEAQAEFAVDLVPSNFDVGGFAEVIGEGKFAASDEAIHEAIAQTLPALSTDLQTDEFARGKGVVR